MGYFYANRGLSGPQRDEHAATETGHVGRAVLAVVVLLPAVTSAQTGTIAGAVKDTTSAVLPGVTVEAASPALIEKVRTVVTDSQGEYKIVDLRPACTPLRSHSPASAR
jgi:hypothetical protein